MPRVVVSEPSPLQPRLGGAHVWMQKLWLQSWARVTVDW